MHKRGNSIGSDHIEQMFYTTESVVKGPGPSLWTTADGSPQPFVTVGCRSPGGRLYPAPGEGLAAPTTRHLA